jgi:hypothetical protein
MADSVGLPSKAAFWTRGMPHDHLQEYQQRAQACLVLARESEQIFAKIGLIELAAEFLVQAEAALDPREAD